MWQVTWLGIAPSERVMQRLRAAGWQVVPAGGLCILHLASEAELTSMHGVSLVLCDRTPSTALLIGAAEAGVVDVLCTQEPDWEARLLRRLAESLVEEETPQVPRGFVAESAAS